MNKMNLSQIIRVWTNGRSPHTVRAYQSNIEKIDEIVKDLYGKSILDVTTGELGEAMRAWHVDKAPVSRSIRTWIIKGFFNTVERLGVRTDNPGTELRPPKFEDKLADRILTHEQVELMVGGADSDLARILLRLLYGAGLRISEAINMKKKDVLGGGVLRVHGKGGKTAYVRIQPSLDTLLAGWMVTHTGDYLIPGYHKNKPMARSTAHNLIKAIARKVGLPQVSAHFFRHAHASVALQNGAPIDVVQKSLRHSSITTTMRYLHTNPRDGAGLYLPANK